MPDLNVTIKLSKLQDYEKELAWLKARNRFLEISYHAGQQTKAGIDLLEAKQDTIDALNNQLNRKLEDITHLSETIDSLAESAGILGDACKEKDTKIQTLENFISSRSLKTVVNDGIYQDNQFLKRKLKKEEELSYWLKGQLNNVKSALAVEASNVCDLDQEKQDLIEILADRNSSITCLKADKANLEKHLADIIDRNISFTLSGDYQMTKISKGKSFKSYKQMYPEVGVTVNNCTFAEDDDIDDEPDPSIGW